MFRGEFAADLKKELEEDEELDVIYRNNLDPVGYTLRGYIDESLVAVDYHDGDKKTYNGLPTPVSDPEIIEGYLDSFKKFLKPVFLQEVDLDRESSTVAFSSERWTETGPRQLP